MNRVRRIIHADEVHQKGITGRGITAAILDSGICPHPDYMDRVIYFQDFVGRKARYYDDASHGSHVTGILGGNGRMSGGKYCGIAKECDLVHLKVLDQYGIGKMKDMIAGMEWILRNYKKFNIRVVNISVGTSGNEAEEETLLINWVERLWDAGMTVIVAAGNMGPEQGTITIPGTSKKVITVGASDDYQRGGIRLKQFYSGRGPTTDCICKPEITAPGSNITSCSNVRSEGRYYCVKSGTSMATPIVAGAVCLLLSCRPYLSNVEVKMLLKERAENLNQPKYQQGWGRMNLLKLLE
ncbi:MAG: S8 family peptidase [Lachnospiraceae bacterium]|nr:S8 family peptidase [Lachnospiraceae bacterium]MDD3795140.1 S8 family peptidase [Lachnospiraceae bacterium]